MTSFSGPVRPRRVRSAPFVGRRAELDAVDAAWEEADRGEPRTVWVEGEAGTGKTAFIARCTEGRAAAAVLSAAGDEAESALPLGLLDQLAADLPRRVVERFPSLGGLRDARPDTLAIGADLLGALGSLPGEKPVLVVLDDVQWADTASVRVLSFALRRLRHDRVLVLAGSRVPGPGPDATPADERWERLLATGRGVRHVRLEGLDPAELSELAAGIGRPLGSTGAAERLWRHTRGHPLHARTLLEELPPEVLSGTIDVLPAPRSLPSVVLVRLARVPPATRALVVAASVLGESCPLGLVAAVAGLDDPAPALDDAVRLGLIEERPGGPPVRVGFVHPLIRAAVRDDLAPTRRRELHRAAARLLSGRAALDHRLAAAAGPDPELAGELEALVTDPTAGVPATEAADLLRAAAELTTDPDDRERRLLAAVARLLGDGEVARALTLEDAVEQCRPGTRRAAVLGQLALLSGRFGRARARLELAAAPGPAGVDGPTDDGDLPAATAAAHLAVLHVLQGDPARAIERAVGALGTPGQSGGVRLPAGLALVLGLAMAGRRADAHAVLDRAPAPGGVATVDVVLVRGVLAALADDDAVAAAHLEDAVRRVRAGETARGLALALVFLPAVRDRTGATAGVTEGFEMALTVARDGGTTLPGTLAHAFAAEALALRGRREDARGHLAAGVEHGPRWWGAEVCLAVAAAVLGEVEGDPDAVLRALEPVRPPAVRALADGLGLLAPRVLEADALLALDRLAEAADALAELDALVGPTGRYGVDAARLRLRLARASGEGPAPRSVAAAGLGGRPPLAVARLETEIGRHLLAAGERRAGVDLLRAAHDRLATLGAEPFRAHCEQLLHSAGLTPSREDEALGLTPHEEAVVALVARGLTNREVGRDLFITPRTVAYHLSNVYAKLGVTSRRQLRDVLPAG